MDLKKITVKTKATGNCKSKERTYDSQILELGDQTMFYIMSKTARDILNFDHFKLEDIASVSFDGHVYLVSDTGTTNTKSKYPIIYTTRIA